MEQPHPYVVEGHFYPTQEYYKHLVRWFSNKYCKTLYHSHMDPHISHLTHQGRNVGKHIMQVWGRPETHKIDHAMSREFRHLHDKPVRGIISAYFQHFQKRITAEEAKQSLVRGLLMEIKDCWQETKQEDQPVLQFLATDKTAQEGLHQGLLSLGANVWVIEWCGDWKSISLFWDYQYGPGYLLVTRTKNHKRPVYFTKERTLPVHLNGRFEDGDETNLKRLEHEDLERIIRHAWLGTLDEIFRYNIVSLQKECQVSQEDVENFEENIQRLHEEWVSEDNAYSKTHPDNTYYWIPERLRSNAIFSSNPYFCRLLIGDLPERRDEQWEQRFDNERQQNWSNMSQREKKARQDNLRISMGLEPEQDPESFSDEEDTSSGAARRMQADEFDAKGGNEKQTGGGGRKNKKKK